MMADRIIALGLFFGAGWFSRAAWAGIASAIARNTISASDLW